MQVYTNSIDCKLNNCSISDPFFQFTQTVCAIDNAIIDSQQAAVAICAADHVRLFPVLSKLIRADEFDDDLSRYIFWGCDLATIWGWSRDILHRVIVRACNPFSTPADTRQLLESWPGHEPAMRRQIALFRYLRDRMQEARQHTEYRNHVLTITRNEIETNAFIAQAY